MIYQINYLVGKINNYNGIKLIYNLLKD